MSRFRLPILVPLGALAVTAAIISLIGLLLLQVCGWSWSEMHPCHNDWGFFEKDAPVITALVVSLVVLVIATVLARSGRKS
jgi:xanthine/uracil permease